jgi:hypothetical protein
MFTIIAGSSLIKYKSSEVVVPLIEPEPIRNPGYSDDFATNKLVRGVIVETGF